MSTLRLKSTKPNHNYMYHSYLRQRMRTDRNLFTMIIIISCFFFEAKCKHFFNLISGKALGDNPSIKELFDDPTHNISYDVESEADDDVPYHGRGIPDEQRLMHFLLKGYEKTVRPVRNASTAVIIRMGLTLTQIFDMDEKDQILVTNVWLDQEWVDEFLQWNPADFANISMIRIPCFKLWLPDIVLYNNAAEYTDGHMPANAMVNYDGNVFWPVPTKLQSSCKVDVTYFPFDEQSCRMKFGSWTYDGFQVDIVNRTTEVDLSNYVDNGEWQLLSIQIYRNVVFYTCCKEPFPDVTFIISIQRRTLYYMYNVIFPCIMMSALTLLVFCLPPDSGEKIALGITVLLAFSVFMLAVAENLPETSEFVPLISIYLTIVMALTSMSVIMTVFVLNLHHRGPNKKAVPRWLHEVLVKRLAPFICLREETQSTYYNNEDRFIKNVSLKITLDNIQQALQNEIQLENSRPEPNSTQDQQQHHQQNQLPQTTTTTTTTNCVRSSSRLDANNCSTYQSVAIHQPQNILTTIGQFNDPNRPVTGTGQYQQIPSSNYEQASPKPVPSSSQGVSSESQRRHKKRSANTSNLSKTNEEILHSLRRILEKHEKEDRDYEVIQEWRRVAQVVDRILFFIFLTATFSSTVGVLVIAPASRHW